MNTLATAAGGLVFLLASGATVSAQDLSDRAQCISSLRYANGDTIDARNLQVYQTVTDGTFSVMVYPTMTPESICNILVPARIEVRNARAAAATAEMLRKKAEDQGSDDREFREEIELNPIRKRPYAAMGVTAIATVIAMLVIIVLWKVLLILLRRFGALVSRRRNRGKFSKPHYSH